jgi:hypothetical protein
MNINYEYDILIDESAPLAPQPAKINIPLKPHQRASLHKAIVMETQGRVHYNCNNPDQHLTSRYGRTGTADERFSGKSVIESNIGVLGDAIGSGKTALALSIVASTSTSLLHERKDTIKSYQGSNCSYIRAKMSYKHDEPTMCKTTLIVVPRGPVFTQFVEAINEQTSLRVLCLDSLVVIKRIMPPSNSTNLQIMTFLEGYDAVLIKNTTLPQLEDYYDNCRERDEETPFRAWERIIVDEVCDILNTFPMYSYKFLWMISATYQQLVRMYSNRHHLAYSMRDIGVTERILNMIVVKCTDQFMVKSFNVPAPIQQFHICELPRELAAVHSFLSANVRERIDANDMMGALQMMGATMESEDTIVTLVTREIERDIRNKRNEIDYISRLEMLPDVVASRLVSPMAELARLEDKLKSLIERVSALEEKSCTICMDSYENPLLLPCNHIFCTPCIIRWMQHNHNTCPTCRATVQSRQLIAIVKDKQETEKNQPSSSSSSAQSVVTIKTKEETLLSIIQANPTGKFVVFSKLDNSYWSCMHLLKTKNIEFNLLRGNSNTMASILDKFRNGHTNVLLLNTVHAASGIDISCATDLIIVHDLGPGRIQAVGRCNRHPRTTPLRIHQLCYPHELNDDDPPDPMASAARTRHRTTDVDPDTDYEDDD